MNVFTMKNKHNKSSAVCAFGPGRSKTAPLLGSLCVINNGMKVAKIKGKPQSTDSDNSATGWILLFVVFMIISAAFYFTYPFAGGEATIGGFIIIWLRELILLGVIIVLFIFWLINRRKKTKQTGNKI